MVELVLHDDAEAEHQVARHVQEASAPADAPSTPAAVAPFIAVLPTAEELRKLSGILAEAKDDRRAALEDLVWGVLTGTFSTGRLSPVIGAWLTLLWPASTKPSAGKRSLGLTRIWSPGRRMFSSNRSRKHWKVMASLAVSTSCIHSPITNRSGRVARA